MIFSHHIIQYNLAHLNKFPDLSLCDQSDINGKCRESEELLREEYKGRRYKTYCEKNSKEGDINLKNISNLKTSQSN